MKALFALILFFITSCSDYKLTAIPYPDIEVSTTALDFGSVLAGGEGDVLPFTVSNVGSAKLEIDAIELVAGDRTFSVDGGYPSSLATYESVDVNIKFKPETFSTNVEKIRIFSNDPDEPVIEIDVSGAGDAPVIDIDPEYHSFYGIYAGCTDFINVNVSNMGNVDLVVDDITHFSSLPANFELTDYAPFYGMLPLVIAPGDTVTLEVNYSPTDAFTDDGYIEISSNDPLRPVVHSDHDGDGDYESWITEEFDQDETTDVDILFVIDNSGSMRGNQTNFNANFSSFMSVFSTAGVDFRIAFITTDSSEIVGPVITAADPDPVGTVNAIVSSIGTSGNSANEAGVYQSYESLQPGASAGPGGEFFRTDAKLVVIYVSDERDWSDRVSPLSYTDYSNYFRSLKTSADLIGIHAVAGDYPSGCTTNGGAEFGEGYFDVVNDFGGSFMSICESDWGTTMESLARESVLRSAFFLNGAPVDGTITVEVDGIQSTDWYYDSTTKTLYFSVVPPPGSAIKITYAVWACQEE